MSNQPKKKMDGNPDANLLSIGNYNFGKTLGEGNFAKVKLAKHKLTGQEVAIKIIDKTSLDEKKLSKLYREVRVMKLLHHPNIVKLYEVVETKYTIFLVMELVSGGELYDYLVVHGRMKEKEARAKFRQIISAVHYCHSKRVIHRDLKAENLLLDANMDVKIADFGFSNQFDPDGKLDTFCGSPPYAAPELFQGKRYTGPEVDVWSLGVILYVLSTGCLPFDGKNLQEMRESVCRGKYRIPFYLSEGCEKLLRKFLVRDPLKRPSLDVIMDDPWLNEGYEAPPCIPAIQVDQTAPEDELILTVIETKFGADKDAVRKGIRENIFDETMAIYFLLLSEKQKGGDAAVIKIGEQMALKNPHPVADRNAHQAATQGNPGNISPIREDEGSPRDNNIILMPNDPNKRRTSNPQAQAQQGGTKPGVASPTVQPAGGSPVVTKVQSPAVAQLSATVKRNRRFTVGNEREVAEMEDGANDPALLEKLRNLQTNGNEQAEQQPQMRTKAVDAKGRPTSLVGQPAESSKKDEKNPSGAANALRVAETRKRTNTITTFLKIGNKQAPQAADSSKAPQNGQQGNNNDFTESSESIVTQSSDDNGADGVPNDQKPRALRFTFNSNTTSSKQPDDIVQEVLGSCQRQNIKARNITRYVVECVAQPPTNMPNTELVKIEIEICKLPRLKNLHGLKFKRISGASTDYKTVCENILAGVSL